MGSGVLSFLEQRLLPSLGVRGSRLSFCFETRGPLEGLRSPEPAGIYLCKLWGAVVTRFTHYAPDSKDTKQGAE